MDKIKKITKMKLFLPIFSMILVMMINVVCDIISGNAPFSSFSISINNGILYGRLIDVLNRGSEVATLAIGMTLVVSVSAGTDISAGSVMSLSGGLCCMLLAGYDVTNVDTYATPLWLGMLAGSIIGAYTIQAITTTLYTLGVSSAQAPVFKVIVVILIVVIQSETVKAYFKKLSAKKPAAKEAASIFRAVR